MSLLFSDVVKEYNKNRDSKISDNELSNKVADFIDGIEDNEVYSVFDLSHTTDVRPPQKVFVASVASEYYSKAQDDIANTAIGNKATRKKNFRQIMQESFFYGANRFGTNFIA